MGSSRASTPAGRRRSTRRAAAAASGGSTRRAAKHPAKKAPPKKKAPAKRAAPKARKPAPKPKKRAPAKPQGAASLRARAPRVLAITVVILGLLGAGYQLWFRNSSFVAVEKVSVAGISGPEREPVTAALNRAAGEMTTLNVDEEALRAAVAGFATVVAVEADADFPHDLAITVTERPPVLIATAGEQAVPVAGDGTVLSGVDAGSLKLASIGVDELPARGKLTGEALEIALVLGAAPEPLRELVEDVSIGGPEGVQVTLRGDIPLYFGGSAGAEQKWTAAAAVLADPEIDTLTYLDVRVPERPSAGGAAPAVTESTTETTTPETAATTP